MLQGIEGIPGVKIPSISEVVYEAKKDLLSEEKKASQQQLEQVIDYVHDRATLNKLTSLKFSNVNFQVSTLESLELSLQQAKGLEKLTLTKCQIPVSALISILRTVRGHNALKTINISYGGFSTVAQLLELKEKQYSNLSAALRGFLLINTSLTELRIRDWQFDSQFLNDISNAIVDHQKLSILDISNNKIGRKGFRVLSWMLEQKSALRKVFVHNNDMRPRGLAALTESIPKASISYLGLSANPKCFKLLNEQGVINFCNALIINRTITRITLSHNRIPSKHAPAFLSLIKVKPNIINILEPYAFTTKALQWLQQEIKAFNETVEQARLQFECMHISPRDNNRRKDEDALSSLANDPSKEALFKFRSFRRLRSLVSKRELRSDEGRTGSEIVKSNEGRTRSEIIKSSPKM